MRDHGTRKRWRRALVAAALSGSLPVADASAQAAGHSTVQVTWSAPPGCPDRAAALAQVADLLGHALVTTRSLSARVQVAQQAEGRWSLQVALSTPEGTTVRELTGASCAQATETAALVLALAIDPGAVASRAHAPPAPRRTPPRLRVQGLARIDAAGDAGVFPAVTGGLGLALGLAVGPARFEAAGTYWLGQRVGAASLPGAGGDLLLLAATLRTCVVYALRGVEFGPCAALEAGLMNATGFGVANPVTTTVGWLAVLGGATIAWRPNEHMAIRAGLEIGAPVIRPRFVFTGTSGTDVIYEPSRVVGRALVGLEVRFP